VSYRDPRDPRNRTYTSAPNPGRQSGPFTIAGRRPAAPSPHTYRQSSPGKAVGAPLFSSSPPPVPFYERGRGVADDPNSQFNRDRDMKAAMDFAAGMNAPQGGVGGGGYGGYGGGGGGGGGQWVFTGMSAAEEAALLERMLSAALAPYAQAEGELGRRRDVGRGEIDQAATDYRGRIDQSYNTHMVDQLGQAVQAQKDVEATKMGLLAEGVGVAGDLANQGTSTQVVTDGLKSQQATLDTQAALQKTFGQNMTAVSNQAQQDARTGGDSVQQGGQTGLANSFADAIGSLLADKASQESQIRMQVADTANASRGWEFLENPGGGGGSGGGSGGGDGYGGMSAEEKRLLDLYAASIGGKDGWNWEALSDQAAGVAARGGDLAGSVNYLDELYSKGGGRIEAAMGRRPPSNAPALVHQVHATVQRFAPQLAQARALRDALERELRMNYGSGPRSALQMYTGG